MAEGYQNLRRNRRSIIPQENGSSNFLAQKDSVEKLEKGQKAAPDGLQDNVKTFGNDASQNSHAQGNFPQVGQVEVKNTKAERMKMEKVEIIAELSANHKQDLDLAFRTVRAIAEAGADAVKLQSYDAHSLTLPLEQPPFIIGSTLKKSHQINTDSDINIDISTLDISTPGNTTNGTNSRKTPWDGRSLFSLYQEAAMPWGWHKPIYKLCSQIGLEVFSTPFCLRGVDFLEQLETPRYKIASFEIGHLELVRRVAATGKPIIVSLGIASFHDIERLLEICQQEGNLDITLLQCTSAYPALPVEANLAMLPHLKSTFGCRVGLSDHSMSSAVGVAAVALGAELIEKHVILSREIGGPDASFSLEPAELAALIAEIRIAESAIGKIDYRLSEQKQFSRQFGRGIFLLRDIKANECLHREDVAVLRPFPPGAIEPQELERIIGARMRCDVSYGSALEWYMLQL